MNVIGTLIAALCMGGQNPSPPDVILPEGWKVHYWSSSGHGTGALQGPDGEEIEFPGYGATGAMAVTTREADMTSLFLNTIIDDRHISVAARKDGYLAVSYPPTGPSRFAGCFDFWTHTKSIQQVADALAICLSHLEGARSHDRDAHATEEERKSLIGWSTRYPFDYMGGGVPTLAYDFDAKTPLFRFFGQEGTQVELQMGALKQSRWEDKRTLLGHELKWGQDLYGRTWASYESVKDKPSVFTCSNGTDYRGMVLAMMCALSYRAPK